MESEIANHRGRTQPKCPLRYPWIEEIEKWLPEVDPRRIRLVQSQGDINEISADRVDVVVVSYGLFRFEEVEYPGEVIC